MHNGDTVRASITVRMPSIIEFYYFFYTYTKTRTYVVVPLVLDQLQLLIWLSVYNDDDDKQALHIHSPLDTMRCSSTYDDVGI